MPELVNDKKSNAAEFNIDHRISNTTPPERSVTVYQDGAAYADFAEAEEAYLRLIGQKGTPSTVEQSLGEEDSRQAELAEVVEQMRVAHDRCMAGRLTLRFRGAANGDDYKRLVAAHQKEMDETGDQSIVYYHLAAKCATGVAAGEPDDTARWRRMRRALGDGQWGKIVEAIDAACLSEDVTPDFSLLPSRDPSTPESSSS